MDNQAHGDVARLSVPSQRGGQTRPAVSVILADDTPDLLTLMRLTFQFHDGIELRGEATNGIEAVELWHARRPDVVVMDLRMPVMSGLEAAGQILAEDPTQRVVLFSAAFRPVDYDLADAIGVARCFDKRDMDRLPELVHALGTQIRQA